MKKTLAVMFAASVATFGCNKSKTDTANPNETFGTVTFVKRGTSKVVRATAFIDPDVISGDEVQSILAQFDGVPVFWDFNNDGSDYDRLRVMGFHTNVRQLIQAATYESLSIDIEGLVE